VSEPPAVTSSDLPDPIAALDAGRIEAVLRLVAEARAAQARTLDSAIEGGLEHIPRPMRGLVRKALFRREAAARPTSQS
jgi:hypothetical protein